MIEGVLIFVGIVCVSLAVHEYGHVLVAKLCGWELKGWVFRWYAVGYAFLPPAGTKHWRWPALGGLLATAMLIGIGWIFAPAPWAVTLFGMNILMFVCQAFPIPKLTDGWVVIKGRR